MLIFNLLLVLIVLYFVFWLWNRRDFYYMEWNIKGPTGYPFIGVGLNFLNRKNVLQKLDKYNKIYGRYYFSFLGTAPILVVTDPVLIEQIFNSDKMIKKSNFYDPIKNSIGDGLFTSENPKWIHDRKIINKVFKHKTLLSFFPIFNNQGRIVNEFIIGKYVGKGECDVFDEFSSLTLYTTMITTMGDDQGDFQSSECTRIIDLFHRGQHIVAERIFNPIFNFIFPVHPSKWKLDKYLKEIRQYVNMRIEKRFTMLAKQENEKSKKTDQNQNNSNENEIDIKKDKNIFIDQAYEFYKTGELTWANVEAECITLMIAAFESTAHTLHAALFFLAIHPEYQDALYKEIMSVCPEDDIEVTYDHIRQMPYSEMVINETMRMIATVPIVARQSTDDLTLDNGLYIAKGVTVLFDIFHLHRNKKFWGPKAEEFNPDNFLKENITKKHPYSFIPFTKGPRNCLGWRYAMFSLQILLVHILKKYKVTTKFKFEDLVCIVFITLVYEKNPPFEFTYRKENSIKT